MASEITSSLRKCSSSSTPASDRIPYFAWKREHLVSPHLLLSLLDLLLKLQYHPTSMKKASGVVLDKPRKPFYGSPSSFKVISLLQTVSKALEKIVTTRLSLAAKSLMLLHHNQSSSLPVLCAFNVVFSLVNTIRTRQRTGLNVTAMFLGLMEGLDNVNISMPFPSLKPAVVPLYMVAWITSFLSYTMGHRLSQGALNSFSPFPVSPPQRSLNSPLLFIIFVGSL